MNWTSPLGRLWGAPLSLGGSIGYEEGPFAIQGEKLDFSLSLTAEIEEIAFAVSYVDNKLQGAEGHAAWIFSISRTF